jgi:hypothetical protein
MCMTKRGTKTTSSQTVASISDQSGAWGSRLLTIVRFSDWAARLVREVMAWFLENVPRQMLNPLYRSLSRNVLSLADTSEVKAIYADAVLRPRREAFSAMIRRARAAGELPDGIDPDLIQDMLSGALLHQIVAGPAGQTEQELRDYVRKLLRGPKDKQARHLETVLSPRT